MLLNLFLSIVLIEQLHQEAILLFFLFVLVLPFLYQVLWLGDEENGGGDIDGQLAPHLARPPVHCRLVEDIFTIRSNGSPHTKEMKPFVDTQGDCAGRQSRSWEQQMVQTQRGPLLGQLDQPEISFVDALHQM